MANIITLTRLLLVLIIGAIAFYAPPIMQLLNVVFVIIAFILDAIDGIIARKRHEVTLFGAIFDIAADRIVEISLWIILAQVSIVSPWIAIIFVMRGILVDSLRKQQSNQGKAPFNIMKTKIGIFLVSSRAMRLWYGFFKLITFSWLFLQIPLPIIWPEVWIIFSNLFTFISYSLISVTVALCLIRGIPVLLEAICC